MMFLVCVCLLISDVFAATRSFGLASVALDLESERGDRFGVVCQKTTEKRAVFFKQALGKIVSNVKKKLAELDDGEDLAVVDWRISNEFEPLEQSLASLKKYVTDRISSLKSLRGVVESSENVEEKKRKVWLLDGLAFAPSYVSGPKLSSMLRFRGGGLICLDEPAMTGEFLFLERKEVDVQNISTLVKQAERALTEGDGFTPSFHKAFNMSAPLQAKSSCVDIVRFFEELAFVSCGNVKVASDLELLIQAFLGDVEKSKFDLPTVHTLALDMSNDERDEKNIYRRLSSTSFSGPKNGDQVLFSASVVEKGVNAIKWMGAAQEIADVGMICSRVDDLADLLKSVSLALGGSDFTTPERSAALKVHLQNMCVWNVPGLQELGRLSDALNSLSTKLKRRAVLSCAVKKLVTEGSLSQEDLYFVFDVASIEEFRQEGVKQYKADFSKVYEENKADFDRAYRFFTSKDMGGCENESSENYNPAQCKLY